MSLPGPPLRTSLPSCPSRTSFPPRPQITSRPGVPTRMSAPGVPVTVQPELVEEDLVAGRLELLLVLVVRVRDRAVEVALDDVGRALAALLRIRDLLGLDLREARRELQRTGQLRAGAGRLDGGVRRLRRGF